MGRGIHDKINLLKAKNITIVDGNYVVLDADDNELARLGKDEDDYGLWLKDTSGNVLFKSVGNITELLNTLIKEGTLKVKDNSDNIRVILGKDDANYGIWIKDAGGNILFRAISDTAELINASIKDGILNVKDGDNNTRVSLGQISEGVYGIKVYDSESNNIIEVSDEKVQVGALKYIDSGEDANDGDIILASLTVPVGRKVAVIVMPKYNLNKAKAMAIKAYQGAATISITVPIFGAVLSADYVSPTEDPSYVEGSPTYSEKKEYIEAGTYSNIKIYSRYALWFSNAATPKYYDYTAYCSWITLEMDV